MKKILFILSGLFTLIGLVIAGLIFLPKNGDGYRLRVQEGQGMLAVAKQLAQKDKIFSRHLLIATAYFAGVHNQLKKGNYQLPASISIWQIVQRLKEANPNTITVRIIEGTRFAQMRQIINQHPDLSHDTTQWSDEQILQAVAPNGEYSHPEGLFAPDSFDLSAGDSDLNVYQLAFQTMQKNLQTAWNQRQEGLPYQTPYEMLIMASIIEKETANPDDRAHISAVFVNRLKIKMRLQTDPTVIYGMGDAYQGKIRKADLQRDTPYNTYTRNGLPPTPISLPSRAALLAAAKPSDAKYLYFVSKKDGTGLSQFSHNLDEHNAAVRKYILKK